LGERRNGCTGNQAYYKTQSKHSVSSALRVAAESTVQTLIGNLSRVPGRKTAARNCPRINCRSPPGPCGSGSTVSRGLF
jgi:hypothetical protein